MSLDSGTSLGSYEIQDLLGTGGMGEVYRARDTKLDRDVAIKVLPSAVADDPVALARFEREARAVAALAHPNILAIYDLGRDGGHAFAAMELLEGQTLRDRLNEGPLAQRKTIELARQIARGLGAAHERGIVHRDLKPENIFITRDGQAKILDFGLAVERASAGVGTTDVASATRTSLTAPGTVMGTVGYMAPEQVRGEQVDHRADIFAFGSVLYEMLTSDRAFQRDTAAETMTAILREEPTAISSRSGPVSPALERVVLRCLEKNRDERFQSARDLAFAVDNSGSISGVGELTAPAPSAGESASGRRGWLIAAAAALLGVAVGFGAASMVEPSRTVEPVRIRSLTNSGLDSEPSASPDGTLVAFRSTRDGTPRIWIRQVVGGGEQPLTTGPDISPSFSPDGSTLLFLRDEGDFTSIYRQSLVGGQPRKLIDDASQGAWSPDGSRIAYARTRPTEGGLKTQVGIADGQEGGGRIVAEFDLPVAGLSFSPDGRRVVAVRASVTGNVADMELISIDLTNGEVEKLQPETRGFPISSPMFTASGHIVFALAGSLLGDQGDPLGRVVRFDPQGGETETLFWTTDLFPLQGTREDFTTLDILRPETLVFHNSKVRQSVRLFDLASGSASPRESVLTRGEGRDRQPVFSPDGRRVVFSSSRSGNLDLWSVDVDGNNLRQLTDDAAQDWDPGFTPDGRQIVWSSDRSGHLEIWIANADGSGSRRLTDDGVDAENPTVTRDGEWVVFWSANPEKRGIWKVRLDGSEPTRLAIGPHRQPEVSPDGRYAAYIASNVSQLKSVIHVVDVTTGESVPFRIEVPTPLRAPSIIFGRLRWLPDGSGLAYVGVDAANRTGIFAQDFIPGSDTTASRRPLAGFSPDFVSESFGLSPDGRSIAIGAMEMTSVIMLAEGVHGIDRPR